MSEITDPSILATLGSVYAGLKVLEKVGERYFDGWREEKRARNESQEDLGVKAQLAAIHADLSELKADTKAVLEKLSDHGERLASLEAWRSSVVGRKTATPFPGRKR